MMKKENIVLIGFMGSGKTTVGMCLSRSMSMPIEDTDKLIEKRQGKAISAIFADEGEEYFRELETQLIKELINKRNDSIISVGGGTPVRNENRMLLKRLGTVVYFRIKPETVYERLKGDASRPLLQCDNPLVKIQKLLLSRKEAYEECADILVDVDELCIDEVVECVKMELKKYGRDRV